MIVLRISTLLIALAILPGMSMSQAARKAPPRAPAKTSAGKSAALSPQFREIAKKADAARENGELDQAIALYQQGIGLNNRWREGWWYLATLLYDKDQYPQAAKAFANSVALNPQTGAPIVMLGLCEFRLGMYDDALGHIIQGRKLGLAKNPELNTVMRFHEGMLLCLKGEFEVGEKLLDSLSYENVNNEQLYIAHGLCALRIPSLPGRIDRTSRDYEMIRRAGYAQHLTAQLNKADGQLEYQRLATEYTRVPGVQYAYGRFLLYAMRNDDGAIEAFNKEIENSPNHALARLQISYIKLKNKEPQDAIKLAEEASHLNPGLALAHFILGRAYLDSGDAAKSIPELELTRKLAPNESKVYFALSRAYAKVGRKADADQARQTFAKLNALENEAGASSPAFEEPDDKKPGSKQ